MQADKSIFKAYDIRGIYPDQLNEEIAYAVGRAAATLLIRETPGKRLKVGVGGDMRISTPTLKAELMRGLTDSGIDVVDIGLVSTPTYYFAVAYFGLDAGVQVSASHNPKEYNGFKLVRKGARAMSGKEGIDELYRIISEESYVPVAEQQGTVEIQEKVTEQAIQEYLSFAGHPELEKFKIVIDVANAMGALDYGVLFNRIPGDLVRMNFDLDGTFPSHEADPIKDENTEDLRNRVVAEKADLGIAADGDADRVFLIDENGQVVRSPILFAILLEEELKKNPSANYAYEIRMGRLVEDMFRGKEGQLIQTPVGHSLIKKIMNDNDAVFGGEISGHYFFRAPFGTFEAPALLVIKILEILTNTGQTLSELAAKHHRYVTSGEINTKVESRQAIERKIEEIKQKYSDGKQLFIDGIKVDYPDFWFSLRASNTEPVMRLIVEAGDEQLMVQKRNEILAIIRS